MENNWHEGIDRVIREPLLFKKKLGIGEEAYKSLSIGKSARQYWDLLGAAGTGATIAKSAVIASTFFQPTGLMAFLGLASASTPVGWVVFAAVASAGAWYGIDKYYNKARDELVDTIPKFINTPIDVIGVAIFNLTLPLSLKVAKADGHIHNSEEEHIRSYFVDEWGYDEQFYLAGYKLFLADIDKHQTSILTKRLSEFQKHSPDCNEAYITAELVKFLEDVMDADGIRHPEEEQEVRDIKAAIAPRKTAKERIFDGLPWMRPKDNNNKTSVTASQATLESTLTKLTIRMESSNKRLGMYETLMNEQALQLGKLEEKYNHLESRIASLATLERMLVELTLKTNNNEDKISKLVKQVEGYDSQLRDIANNNTAFESRIAQNRKYIYWLSVLAVSSGLLTLACLFLITTRYFAPF